MQLSEKDFSEYLEIVKRMAKNCQKKLTQPSQYTTEELMGEAFITIMKLMRSLDEKGVKPGSDQFKYTMIKSVSNTFKMIKIKNYNEVKLKRLPKVILDASDGHTFLAEEITEKLNKKQLEYVRFLLSPPIELVEVIRNQSHKEYMKTIRKYLGGMSTQKERKLRQSIYLTLIGEV